MPNLDLAKLLDVSRSLFSTEGNTAILAHATLAFCETVDGNTLNLSTLAITSGANKLFTSLGEEPIDDDSVKKFVLRLKIHPVDMTLIARIGAFVISECINNNAVARHPVIIACISWWNFVDEAKRKLDVYTADEKLKRARNQYFDSIIKGLRHLTQHPDAEDIYIQFFSELGDLEYSDICYFLSYRYSLTPKKLIKTFISISTPAFNRQGIFEYHHVHRHQVDAFQTRQKRETLRAARGILVGIDKSYYFLGGSVLRRRDALGTWPVYPDGIQVITLEKEQFRYQAPGLVALFLTNNNSMRPMSGRSVLIPLGRARDIGKQTYKTFNLDVFDEHLLEEVVRADLAQIGISRISNTEVVKFIHDVLSPKHFGSEGTAVDKLTDLVRRPILAEISIPT